MGCGKCYLKFYDASDKTFKEIKETVIPLKYEKENDFVDVCFFPDSSAFVVVSAQRNVFIIDNNQVLYYIQAEFSMKDAIKSTEGDMLGATAGKEIFEIEEQKDEEGEQKKSEPEISTLVVHKKGFIIGSKNVAFLNVYEVDKDYAISLVDSYQCGNASDITSLALSYDRSFLVFGA